MTFAGGTGAAGRGAIVVEVVVATDVATATDLAVVLVGDACVATRVAIVELIVEIDACPTADVDGASTTISSAGAEVDCGARATVVVVVGAVVVVVVVVVAIVVVVGAMVL